jgi:aspartate/tyrosine/aromatic aminotransferase
VGTIINTKKQGNKIVAEILSDYNEYLQLKGHFENIRIFSENIAEVQTNISQRGKNAATKYFLIPKQFRKGFKFNNTTACQKMEFDDKIVFIYVVDKGKTNPQRSDLAARKIEEKYGAPIRSIGENPQNNLGLRRGS